MTEESVKEFLKKNFPTDLLQALEYDDPKAIARALKLLGLNSKIPEDADNHHSNDADSGEASAKHEIAQ